jgi:1-deoxy-D-xylulose-5-phosphate synthase
MTALPIGKAEIKREGRAGLLILAFGALVKSAEIIGERLDATVVNMRFVKPLDEELVLRLAARHQALVTIEENAIAGGAGSAVIELLANCSQALPTLTLGIPDRFIEHGSREDCLVQAELDPASLGAAVERWWTPLAGNRALSGT